MMKKMNKTTLSFRTAAILRGNDGASLVLVTIIAIIIITGVIVLRTTTSALWASADKQLNQDRAYELATSLGESMNTVIEGNNSVDFAGLAFSEDVPEIPNAHVDVTTTVPAPSAVNGYYVLKVHATVSGAEYTYTATYTNSGVGQAASFRRVY